MLTKMLECMVSPLGDHSQMIKAVVFDIGGVLEITPRTGWDQTWADRLSLTRAQLIARLEPVWSRGSRICGVRSSRRCGGAGAAGISRISRLSFPPSPLVAAGTKSRTFARCRYFRVRSFAAVRQRRAVICSDTAMRRDQYEAVRAWARVQRQ